ncbi:unnamed protein product [Rotaria magnacalcarata]|uniref:von Willebrand factor A domain-containing protein 7 n=4 Tax=Rotaria magnacalcarata TaxID=392030 RepID=A0A819S5S9_9BILA|nr:unnamed protein product [Rotaria magnacalcarata]CAF1995642.1 unnamed protein product [Rotaria magnacalcarata]CAF2140407.1 unnamed protein product [Rotaria magnacalcarata]CAF2181365.1 unnamed protein product [Rotaria magnacalcarata]CAF4051598.1 unnamed protein product [Rotaria magnacalcarata]
MTECAVLDMASEYLKTIYKINSLESIVNAQYGRCNVKGILEVINIELGKLKIDQTRLFMAMQTIADENRKRDAVEFENAPTHFDGETFDDGALLISRRFDAAISNANSAEYEKSRVEFGSLLHTVQDFYSHSNWIEIGYGEPNNGIGKYEVLGKYASKEMRTCVDCVGTSCRSNIVRSILQGNVLTSGYFSLNPVGSILGTKPKPFGKCSHGGLLDVTTFTDAKGGGINKDTLTSVHGHLHQEAASVAYDATKQILHEFWKRVGDEPFGQFLGLSESLRNISSSSLIIVMDTTGSMASYIAMAKQIAISIVDSHQTLEYKPSNYILSPFNDPTWGPLTTSLTPQQFTNEISKLTATGGGDGPELYYHGILDALQVCEIGSSLYAFTDAPAKDAYLKSQVVQLAKDKRVTITLFYARSSQKRQTGNIETKVTDVIEDLTIIDGNDLSSITGGIIMGVNAQSLSVTQDYIINRLDIHKLKSIVFARGDRLNLTFYVDSSMKTLRIEVTSSYALTTAGLRLTKSSGEILTPIPSSQTPYVFIYTVPLEQSDVGEWNIFSPITVVHNIQLNAISNISCSATLQKQLVDSSSDLNFVALTGRPIQDEKDLFVLTICDNLPSDLITGEVHLMDTKSGSSISEILTPIRVSPNGFLSRISVPRDDFRLKTVVHLKDGSLIQRQEKRIISPTSIALSIDNQPYYVLLNETVSMNYTLYNYGQNPLRVTLRVNDALGLLSSSGILKVYDIVGNSNVSDTIEMNTRQIVDISSNTTMITDSVLFSIAGLNFEYEDKVSVYIQPIDVPLTEQTEYQKPSRNSAKKGSTSLLVQFILMLFVGLYQIYV